MRRRRTSRLRLAAAALGRSTISRLRPAAAALGRSTISRLRLAAAALGRRRPSRLRLDASAFGRRRPSRLRLDASALGRRRPTRLWLAAAALGLLGGLAGFSGCAEPPQRTISAARTAFSELREGLGGETWAPDEYRAAEATLRQAEAELRAQSSRMGFRRDYRLTLELFRAAQEDVEIARLAASAGRSATEMDARQAVDAAVSAVDNARAAVLVAPVGRDARSAAGRLDAGLEKAEEDLAAAREHLQKERFREAQAAADAVLEDVAGLIHQAGRARRGGL